MHPLTSHHRNRCKRSVAKGFSLLETLLAISLISVLMATIATSTSLYVQYRSRALEGSRDIKVLRGTIDDLRNDLRACYQGERAAAGDLFNAMPAKNGNTGISERILSFSASQTEQAIHFVGRSNAILLRRQGQNPRFANGAQNYTSNDCQILWLAPAVSSLRLPRSQINGRITQNAFHAPRDQRALMRTAFALNATGEIPATTLSSSSAKQDWDANDAVDEIEFRFFDGSQWLKEWNSHQQNDTIPLAVEVILAMVSDPDQRLRFVIRLPVANEQSVTLGPNLVDKLSDLSDR